MDEWTAYIKDRDAALLSLDPELISAFYHRWNLGLPPPEIFWIVIHKVRTAIPDLPASARQTSIKWLHDRGYQSWED